MAPRYSGLDRVSAALDFALLKEAEVEDYAELERLGHVSRARLTQIMNLTLLAPDIQEQILFLPAVIEGRDPLKEWQVRPVAAEAMWTHQRPLFQARLTEIGCTLKSNSL